MDMRMPRWPAPPQIMAHRLQPVAAMTPRDTSVSMVKAPWRRARKAALWKGQAAQVTTGAVSSAMIHCQPTNWRAGTMEIAMTGTDMSRARMRRCLRSAARSRWEAPIRGAGAEAGSTAAAGPVAASAEDAPGLVAAAGPATVADSTAGAPGAPGSAAGPAGAAVAGVGAAGAAGGAAAGFAAVVGSGDAPSPSGPAGRGPADCAVVRPVTAAVYPARATVAMSSSSLTSRVRTMWADSVARLTLAVTPSSLPSFFSTRATQEAQVMPPTARSTVPIGAVAMGVWLIEGSWGTATGRSRSRCGPARRRWWVGGRMGRSGVRGVTRVRRRRARWRRRCSRPPRRRRP